MRFDLGCVLPTRLEFQQSQFLWHLGVAHGNVPGQDTDLWLLDSKHVCKAVLLLMLGLADLVVEVWMLVCERVHESVFSEQVMVVLPYKCHKLWWKHSFIHMFTKQASRPQHPDLHLQMTVLAQLCTHTLLLSSHASVP